MIAVAQFGAGRIGQIHARNVASHGVARLKYVIDVNRQAAETLATAVGAQVVEGDTALADPDIGAVVIATSTDTHADLIEAAARAGKAIFCEKPIDLDLARTKACLAAVAQAAVPLLIGFNRRFDPSFAALKAALDAGRIGKLENLSIISRDPEPPPAGYVARSGGFFRDMTIHDFDMARWLMGAEPVRLYARGSVLVDPAIGEVGDIDSAVVVLETAVGVFCQIVNSRRASFGYDQRIEAFGEKGLLLAGNREPRSLQQWDADGLTSEKPHYFFLERYAEAFQAEMTHFLSFVAGQEKTLRVSAHDGLRALELAEAANQSLNSGQAVAL